LALWARGLPFAAQGQPQAIDGPGDSLGRFVAAVVDLAADLGQPPSSALFRFASQA
jgi:hypothetical protein